MVVSRHLRKAQERGAAVELAAWELLASQACAPAFPLLHRKGAQSALKVRSARFSSEAACNPPSFYAYVGKTECLG